MRIPARSPTPAWSQNCSLEELPLRQFEERFARRRHRFDFICWRGWFCRSRFTCRPRFGLFLGRTRGLSRLLWPEIHRVTDFHMPRDQIRGHKLPEFFPAGNQRGCAAIAARGKKIHPFLQGPFPIGLKQHKVLAAGARLNPRDKTRCFRLRFGFRSLLLFFRGT